MLLLLLAGCARDAALPDTGAPAAGLPEGYTYGDPIQVAGQDHHGMVNGRVREWLAAAFLSDEVGVLVGESGLATVTLPSCEPLHVTEGGRGYRVSLDGDVAWVATRDDAIYALDLSDPSNPWDQALIPPLESWHEDVAADGGRVLVGAQEAGAPLFDANGRLLSTLEADYAFGVALRGARALVADAASLVLWDVSDALAPAELDRLLLPATGRDLSWDADRVAVAMGGSGVAVVSTAQDRLALEAHLDDLPGAPSSVALSGERLWITTWDEVVLARRTEDGWRSWSHEAPAQSAIGVAARGQRALLGDFTWCTLLEASEGLAGPELDLPEALHAEAGVRRTLTLRNHGQGALELSFDELDGVELSENPIALEAGERRVLELTPTRTPARLSWTSNDPDEPSGTLLLEPGLVEGQPHPDFELMGFAPPSPALQPYRLSEQRGEVVFLGFFTTW